MSKRQPGKAGRPPFKVTATMRRRVEEYVSVGMSHKEVSRAIGCTENTLVKHFPEELATGLAKKRAQVIQWLYKAAHKGSVPALRKLEEMTRVAGMMADPAKPVAPEAPEKLGKKQIAALAATKVGGAGSDWGDDLEPDALPN